MLKTTRLNTVQGILGQELNYPLFSLTPIEGVDINKDYRINPLIFMKYKKGKIELKELKAEYHRQLDARGKHLVEGDLRHGVLVCECENKVHIGDCAVKLLKEYVKIKEDICTADDIKKTDLQSEWDNAVVDVSECPHCGNELEDDKENEAMYCSECDDLVHFEDLES